MKLGLLVFLLFSILYIPSTYSASCKAFEGDPNAPHPKPTTRVLRYDPVDPSLDTSPDGGDTLNILSYNIQSGLTLTCAFQPEAQAQFMKDQHFFGLQEVDINITMRCGCSQPKLFADWTGHTVLFLHTIFYRTGLYGSALSSAFPILETRYKMYTQFSTEERGVLAIRTEPPQLKGKTLWTMNTHLQFDSEYTRVLQIQDMLALSREIEADYPGCLIIATGDYYATPEMSSYALLNSYFANAWATYHGSADGGATYPSDWPNNRVDHIWFRFPEDVEYTLQVQLIRSTLSDHLPLKAYFTFGSSSSATATTALAATTSDSATAATTATTAGTTAAATATTMTDGMGTSGATDGVTDGQSVSDGQGSSSSQASSSSSNQASTTGSLPATDGQASTAGGQGSTGDASTTSQAATTASSTTSTSDSEPEPTQAPQPTFLPPNPGNPTDAPTDEPTENPTDAPTDEPTETPTGLPTDPATEAPTEDPSPSEAPAPPAPGPDQDPSGGADTSSASAFSVSPLAIAATVIALVIYM